jgi:hypothetical protein
MTTLDTPPIGFPETPTVHAVLTPASFANATVRANHFGVGQPSMSFTLAGIEFRVAGMDALDLHEALLNLATEALCASAEALDRRRSDEEPDEGERAELTYDDDLGHICTLHGPTMVADPLTAPTESGSWYYRCSTCGVGGWSGL